MIFRALCALMALLLVAAAAVQLNDPDPLLWIAMYLCCAGLSVAALLGRWLPWLALGAWSLALLAWSGWLATGVLGQQDLFESEEGREMMGLALCGLWCLSLTIIAARRARPGGAA